jgi:hypothetical protein
VAPAPTVINAITMPMKPASPKARGLGLDLPAAAFEEAEAAVPVVEAETIMTLEPDLRGADG